jgi:hypothetical protein
VERWVREVAREVVEEVVCVKEYIVEAGMPEGKAKAVMRTWFQRVRDC